MIFKLLDATIMPIKDRIELDLAVHKDIRADKKAAKKAKKK